MLAIGDAPYDAKAASLLGLAAIGVLTGRFSRAALQEVCCIAVLDQVRHIVPHLASEGDVLERVLYESQVREKCSDRMLHSAHRARQLLNITAN